MDVGLHTGASHLQMLENWQAVISSNLANSSTPGFQKSVFEIARVTPEENGENLLQSTLPVGNVLRAFSEGQIRITGNPYDLAIQSGGFFALAGENGEQVYTKDGEFHLNSDGTLVNKMGWPVLAEGAPLTVVLEEGPITISPDGTVNQKGQDIGRISVYNFANPQALEQGNGSYFTDPEGLAGPVMEEDPLVLQGQLMGSTVNPLTEMVNMIQVSRAYEITQKLIQENDERGSAAIRTFSV
ncbi:MAG: flagellar hook-basal body protein [Verrucomicrobiae bacterium]|nr:flagellar hook-basal body protein [Verrucomicrobiae bacterium]